MAEELPPPGTRLMNRYRLDSVIAQGGVGVIYSAHDLNLDRTVAVKLLPKTLDEGNKRERFLREARVAGSIGHPHVVKVFDAGFFDDERPFLVMELLTGASLDRHLRRVGALSFLESCMLGSQMCSALDAIHQAGVVHRDLKPGNVQLLDAPNLTSKLIDFGMSRSFLTDQDRITAPGRVIGTPSYMAPEQLLGTEPNPPMDVYGVGLVLYEALAGAPYIKRHKRVEETFRAVLQRKPQAPSELRPKIPEFLDELVLRALSRKPEDRFASCLDMKRACDDAHQRLQTL